MLKASAKELLNTIRKAIANMNNWREKETTRAEMAKIIRDTRGTVSPQAIRTRI